MTSSKPTLGYFDVRGLAQTIRFALAYLNIEHEERRYPVVEGEKYGRKQWLEDKWNLDLPFPNVPYWIEGNKKLTESKAILKYLVREKDETQRLLPSHEKLVEADILEGVIADLCYGLSDLCWNYSDDLKAFCIPQQQEKLLQLSIYLGGNLWILGNQMTYVDFLLYEALYRHVKFDKELLVPYANLNSFMERFENIPNIAKYMKSEHFIHAPCISPEAKYKI